MRSHLCFGFLLLLLSLLGGTWGGCQFPVRKACTDDSQCVLSDKDLYCDTSAPEPYCRPRINTDSGEPTAETPKPETPKPEPPPDNHPPDPPCTNCPPQPCKSDADCSTNASPLCNAGQCTRGECDSQNPNTCPAGLACQAGRCRPTCGSFKCPENAQCTNGDCIRSGAATCAADTTCEFDEICQGGRCILRRCVNNKCPLGQAGEFRLTCDGEGWCTPARPATKRDSAPQVIAATRSAAASATKGLSAPSTHTVETSNRGCADEIRASQSQPAQPHSTVRENGAAVREGIAGKNSATKALHAQLDTIARKPSVVAAKGSVKRSSPAPKTTSAEATNAAM